MEYKVDMTYCDKKCPIGMKASREFLDNNNSAYDAALDFCFFVEECFKTCPCREIYNKTTK